MIPFLFCATNKISMRALSRRFTIPTAFFAIVISGYVIYRFVLSSFGVPEEFSVARTQGAFIAQNIVRTSNDLSAALAQVGELERAYNYTDALVLTSELAKDTVAIRTQAVELAAELEKMTRAMPSIQSSEARALALESVTNRLALINHLITYSDYLLQLVDTLRGRFTGTHTDAQVNKLIDRINGEITAINELDIRAQEVMERFDGLTN